MLDTFKSEIDVLLDLMEIYYQDGARNTAMQKEIELHRIMHQACDNGDEETVNYILDGIVNVWESLSIN